jgi:tetratricopeptide (TPR) repeat protein
MKVKVKKYLLVVVLAGLLPQLAVAQLDNEYFVADQLLRQQKFEEAYKKFYQLHQDNPGTFIFLDKATECLINLKEYEQAISLTEKAISRGNYQAQAMIRLGEIYHVSGDKDKAFGIWDQVLEKYAGSQQTYLRVARAMKDRRVYDRAIEIYKKTRDQLNDSNVVTSELAETYLQAGRYEEAIQEYLRLVEANPDRMNFVQRRLIRFKDDYVYDVAILEISDFLDDLSQSHPSYHNLQQLEIWLLMERNLFERALVTAKNFESQTNNITYSLYSLGSKLLAEQQFALAEEAYSYYIDNNIYPVQNRSKEELATVYTEWAKYLENYNLGLSSRREELYQKAYETLESLRKQAPNYQRMDKVLVSLSELSLDVLHQPDKAEKFLEELRSLSNSSLVTQEKYIEGRLHLYDKEYTRARIAFARSNKQERTGDLSEKTRY